ncbi:MAG: DUF1801 domain-containing protein [Devosiaceae bacterium]|nr:DUF1801 domain-containing protein [Devosiaceae bacterium MH13]
MAHNKTQPTSASVEAYLATVEPEARRADAQALDALFRRITGWEPALWSGNMVGFGRYSYRYASGREGEWFATGFAPRKANLSIYIMPGYADFSDILGRLGKHKKGKSCLYLTRLADVDEDVLAELIEAGLSDLGKQWAVVGT